MRARLETGSGDHINIRLLQLDRLIRCGGGADRHDAPGATFIQDLFRRDAIDEAERPPRARLTSFRFSVLARIHS
jgi:hypothetical protein